VGQRGGENKEGKAKVRIAIFFGGYIGADQYIYSSSHHVGKRRYATGLQLISPLRVNCTV